MNTETSWGRRIVSAFCLMIVGLSATTSEIALGAEPVGFKPIFNGDDLTGWSGDEKYWTVQDGVIVGESTPENPCTSNTFLKWTAGQVDDFELTLQFRISGSPQANSGIQYRSQVAEDGHVIGYQADIDLAGKWLGACYDEKGRGMLAARGQKSVVQSADDKQHTPLGDAAELMEAVNLDDWNTYHIIAKGNTLTQKINDVVMSQVVDQDSENRDYVGNLALQLHSGPPMKIEFKEIQLKRLPLTNSKKVVFVAGAKSHGYFSHEHNAGCLLLADAMEKSGLAVTTAVYLNGWPDDVTAFDNADTVVFYCDGGGRHILNPHIEEFDAVMKRGTGIVCLHYAVETVIGEPGDHFIKWMGGFFEPNWSVNPHWIAQFDNLPIHPITRGVEPFSINDEWYYHMRFAKDMKNVTPILTDMPPRETLNRKDGPHSGNPHVRESVLVQKQPQHVGWAFERRRDGRGFGFTGGHFHKNWQNDNFRKVVLNAIAWTANLEVPFGGVQSETPSVEQLEANQDEKQPANWKYEPPVTEKPKKPAEEKTTQRSETKPLTVQTVAAANVSDSRELKDALAQLEVAEGLDAKIFAGEPMMLNPTNIDIDAQGRVWVCEVVNYRQFRNKDSAERTAGDRIIILTDTDKDGTADDVKTFYQGRDIDSAHGICVLGNRALVSAGDSVFWLIDEDGDDKADKKELLFTGISGTQHDHGIHAAVFGPDGKLYFNFGNAGKQIKDKDGQPIIDKQGNEVNSSRQPYQEGMVFRCNLDGSEFETLGWNFRNNWEVCVDSFGTMWQSDNDDDGNRGVRINYVMEFGNYGYRDELTGAGWRSERTGWQQDIPKRHWHQNDPGSMPNLLQTGAGSPTGILIYEGKLLPDVFVNEVIHSDAGPNIVRAYPTEVAGAGYTAEMVNILEGKADKWFRPSDVCIGPDGSLFVADWYDPGVGGHRMGDVDRGRIFRLAPPTAGYEFPETDVSTVVGAINALKSPNVATRYLGWTALQKFGAEAEPALVRMTAYENPRMQARAFWALGKLPLEQSKTVGHVRTALQSFDPNLRIVGIRLVRQLIGEIELEQFADDLNLQDESAAVRREYLIGLRDLDLPDTPQYWTELALQYEPHDRWYLEALGIAAHGRWDECLTAWLNVVGDDWNTPAGRDIVWRSRATQTPQYLAALIQDPATPAAELPRYFRSFDFSPNVEQTLFADLAFGPDTQMLDSATLIANEALARLDGFDLGMHPEYVLPLQKLLQANSGNSTFIALVDRFNLVKRYPELLELAIANSDQQLGVDAIRVLLRKKQWSLLNAGLRLDDTQAATKLADVIGLSQENAAVGLLMKVVQDDEAAIQTRRAIVKALGRTKNGTNKVVEMAKQESIDPELKPAIAATLHASARDDAKSLAQKLFPLPAAKDAKPLAPMSQLVKQTGNTQNGRLVFHTHGTCAKCHQINGLGKEVGPDLSEIGKKLSKQALFESILYPSAGISHNYEAYTVVTLTGNIVTGLLVSESDSEIAIKNAEGIIKTIPLDDVDELVKQSVSLMPADLQKVMSENDLIDVVEYMTTLKVKK